MKRIDLIAEPWNDYELLDSGANRKLERFGTYTIIRPETQALWAPARSEQWKQAAAEFRWTGQKGTWQTHGVPDRWEISRNDIRASIRLTSFKHLGIFPEQAPNWDWIRERTAAKSGMHVLNLFGYTGIASIAAAQGGARVTHIDASKQSNVWAKENTALSHVPEGSIRFLLDDALGFVLREGRRGSRYDGIILDPPAFGRGPKGEVWRIEEHLPRLLAALPSLLSTAPGSFFLLNGYAAGYSPQSFLQAAESAFKKGFATVRDHSSFGELLIEERRATRAIPSGIYFRFVKP